MHNHIRAPAERLLQAWRRERAVHEQVRSAAVRLLCVVADAERLAGRVQRRLEVDHVAGVEVLRGAGEREQCRACEAAVQLQHSVRAVVARRDGDAARAQEDVRGVQGGEAGGVGEGRGEEEGRQERFEPGCGRGGVAGVDVAVGEGGLGEGLVGGLGGLFRWGGWGGMYGEVGGWDQLVWVVVVAEGGGYVDGWGDVFDAVEVVVCVDGLCGGGPGAEGGCWLRFGGVGVDAVGNYAVGWVGHGVRVLIG